MIKVTCQLEDYSSPTMPRIITNGDRIRAMTDEELADWLFQAWHQSWYTLQEWTDWLKEEVTND